LVFGTTFDITTDLIGFGVYGAITLVLMRVSIVINDKLILSRFCVHKEITQDHNVGTAFAVGGSCLATGFMINGALSGHSESFVRGIFDLGVYFLIGQALLVVGGLIFQAITNYDVHHTIEHDDNAAAGLSFGGFLAAIGIITKTALSGASSNLLVELVTTVMLAASGLLLLCLVRVIADKVLLPSSPLCKEVAEDKNVAAGAVAAASFVAVALAFAFVISGPGVTPVDSAPAGTEISASK
jgi:uncharacterized membrane protein YjfL (UPF0719 family)